MVHYLLSVAADRSESVRDELASETQAIDPLAEVRFPSFTDADQLQAPFELLVVKCGREFKGKMDELLESKYRRNAIEGYVPHTVGR